jgi:hypothetical protein
MFINLRVAFRREVYEHQAVPDAHPAAVQRPVGRIEPIGHGFRGDQVAFEVIDPGVIGAGELAHRARLLQADAAAAVAAQVEEGADLAVPAAHQDDRFAGDLVGDVIAVPGNARGMVDEQPLPGDDPLDVALEDRRIGVERLLERQSRRLPAHQFLDGDVAPVQHRRSPDCPLPAPGPGGGAAEM